MATQNLKRKKNNNLKNQKRNRPSKVSPMTNCLSTKQEGKPVVEEDIKALKQQMEFILGVTKTGLDIIDSEFNIRYIDPAWAKVYGAPNGKKCYQYFMDRSEVCPDCGIPIALKTKTIAVTEEILVKEGNRPIQVTTIPFQNNHGEWLVAEVNVDISERNRTEEALHKAYDEMEMRVQERTAELVRANEALKAEVAERKRVERELRESEGRHKELADFLPEMIYETDESGNIIFANRRGFETFGYTQEDFNKGLSIFQMVIPEDRERVKQNLLKLLQGEKFIGNEYAAMRKDGSTFPIFASVNLIVKNNKPIGVRGVVIDITERKRAEEGIKESQKTLATILDSVDADIYIADMKNYQILFINKHMKDHFGHDLVGKICWQVFRGESRPCAHCTNNKLLDPEGHPTGVIVWENKNPVTGSWYLNYDRAIKWVDGRLVRLQVASNITERKNAEQALRESEERYRTILENIENGYYEVDIAGNLTFCNDSFCRLFGYSKDEMMGMNNRQYTDEENANKLYQAFNKVYRTRKPTKAFDLVVIRKDGTKLFGEVSVSLVTDAKGQPIGFRGIARDITERKQTERALRESEEKYRAILENIEEVYYEVDIGGNFTFFNDSAYRLFGYSRDEMMGMNNRQYTDEENAKKLYEAFNKVYKTGETTKGFDWEIIRKDGTKRYIEASVSLVKNPSGEPIGFRGIVRDITERKQAEEALRKSEEKYRLVSENIPVAVYSALPDEHSTNLLISGKMEELTGYPGHQFIADPELWMKVIHPEDREQVWREVEKHRRERKSLDIEYRLITQDNITKWIKDKAIPALNEKGEIIRIDGFMEDITEHKRAEEALRESEERYRTILENIEDGYYEVDLPGNFTFFNDSLRQMLGYSKDEMIGMGNQRYTNPENRKKLFQAFNEVYRTGKPTKGFDWEVFRKDGTKLFGEVSVSLIKDSKGQPIGFRGIARDITQRKNTEEALRLSEKKYRELYQNLRDGSAAVNMEGKIIEFNEAFHKMLGYEKEEIYKLTYEDITPKKWHSIETQFLRDQVFKKGYSDIYEKEYRKKDGTIFPVNLRTYLIKDENGTPVGMWAFVRDISEQKQAEESLRSERQRLASLVENSPFGMVMIDQDGNFQYMNPKFEYLFGYDLTDVPDGKTWFKKAYPDPTYRHDVISAWVNDLKSSKTGEKRSRIFKVTSKDGTEKIINFIPVQLDTGENLMACEDITERKHAEVALEESEEKFRAMTVTAADAITVMDNQGCITYWNPSAEKMFGFSPQEVTGKELHLFLAPKRYHEAYKKGFSKFMTTGQGPAINNTLEFIAIRKDGTEFPMEVSTSAFRLKGQWHAVGIIRDITERKRVEEALKKSEERLQELFNDAPVGYFEYDVDGRLTDVNRTELEMLGYSREEMIGQPAWKFVNEEEIAHRQVLKKLAGISPPARGIERTYRRKNGTTFPTLIEDRLLKDSEGKIIGIRSTIQDITDLKRAEKEMIVLEEQLRQSQKMEAIGQLAGGIAHDFNNLLTVMKGYSQLSLLDLTENDPLWGNIQEIQKATQRAADLTRQLLAFSRRQILDLKVLDLNTLLRDLNKMLRRIIGEDIELVTLLAEDLGRVRIDPGQFEQMILNLAVNARDAMPSGGKLTIETANIALDEEYAHAHISVQPGSYVQLSISDTGVGIPLDIKEKVFEPFFTTKEKGRGTGLGLSTVYGIVKQCEGNIWVYSEPGHGTTFKVYLPRVEEELDTALKTEETDSLPSGKETVLLVEDDPLVRDLAHRLLTQQGYMVYQASNGEEGLRVAQNHAGEKIHLLLTDVVMPQMGGKELAEKLKLSRPDIEVLYTSGYTDNAIVHHGVLESGTHFLQKPFSHRTLSHKVREVLDRE
jgi:PAS domain S-box-containing protein